MESHIGNHHTELAWLNSQKCKSWMKTHRMKFRGGGRGSNRVKGRGRKKWKEEIIQIQGLSRCR